MATIKFDYSDGHKISHYVDLTLEGGGSLGAAYCGALMALQRNGVWFKRVAGNSAGAITGSLIAAGYNADEIDYLFSPNGAVEKKAPSTITKELGRNYLDYFTFLDTPTTPKSLNNEQKRNTLLYKSMSYVWDQMMQKTVNFPDLVAKNLDTIINIILHLIPDSGGGPWYIPDKDYDVGPIKIKRGQWGTISEVRIPKPGLDHARKEVQKALAGANSTVTTLNKLVTDKKNEILDTFFDTLYFNAIAAHPELKLAPAFINLFVTGGLFNGDVFHDKIATLMKKKGVVKFKDIKAVDDFAVIATNITDNKMKVYSKTLTPEVHVALAVRESMSIPFVFRSVEDIDINYTDYLTGKRPANDKELQMQHDPQLAKAAGKKTHKVRYWDGGLCDNWPIWYNINYSNTAEEISRPKLALYLNEGPVCDQPTYASDDILPAKNHKSFVEMYTNSPNSVKIPEFLFVEELVKQQGYSTSSGRDAFMQNYYTILKESRTPMVPMTAIEIFLKGYNWLNPHLSEYDFFGMCYRGWQSVLNHLLKGDAINGVKVIDSKNPYKMDILSP